ncbi:hypothetical protein [Methylovulum psychrotolerans]|uniref:hypothetical protein n=1 Tax=Methylovulum psychrotolerans TaxID=1704499 RepID=UPI000CDF1282|nr:hypothetical protein [Methylovulum psychrotolerans]
MNTYFPCKHIFADSFCLCFAKAKHWRLWVVIGDDVTQNRAKQIRFYAYPYPVNQQTQEKAVFVICFENMHKKTLFLCMSLPAIIPVA